MSLVHDGDLADRLTTFSISQALRDLPRLREIYGSDVSVSVNLSRLQLLDSDAAFTCVSQGLDQSGEDPASLRIEVVEDLTHDDLGATAKVLQRVRALGVKVVLDDFGTGASSLSALTSLTYDALKIDRSFTQSMLSNTTARSVVEAVLNFAATTGIDVVAEGVETALQAHALAELGCAMVQGYLIAQPAPIDALTANAPVMAAVPTVSTPVGSAAEVSQLAEAVRAVEVSRLGQREVDVSVELERLDQWAAEIGPPALEQRLEIGRKCVLASIYAGNGERATHWTLHTSRLAEQAEEWGRGAETYALLASTARSSANFSGTRVEALTRALSLRISKPMRPDHASLVDCRIGVAFANLGLWDHALQWWQESERHRNRFDEGTASLSLSLADFHLRILEEELPVADQLPRQLRIARISSIVNMLEAHPDIDPAIAASVACRLAICQGDLATAAAAVAVAEPPQGEFVSRFLVGWARAHLAEADGRSADCLAQTKVLVGLVEPGEDLGHFHRSTLRMHGRSLRALGRFEEAAAVFDEVDTLQQAASTVALGLLFDWIRLQVDHDVRLA